MNKQNCSFLLVDLVLAADIPGHLSCVLDELDKVFLGGQELHEFLILRLALIDSVVFFEQLLQLLLIRYVLLSDDCIDLFLSESEGTQQVSTFEIV